MPPQVNVLATALLVIVLTFMLINLRRQTRRSRAAAGRPEVAATAAAEASPLPV